MNLQTPPTILLPGRAPLDLEVIQRWCVKFKLYLFDALYLIQCLNLELFDSLEFIITWISPKTQKGTFTNKKLEKNLDLTKIKKKIFLKRSSFSRK